jgi:hypothetical protein
MPLSGHQAVASHRLASPCRVDVSALDASLGGAQEDTYDHTATAQRMHAEDVLYAKQLEGLQQPTNGGQPTVDLGAALPHQHVPEPTSAVAMDSPA